MAGSSGSIGHPPAVTFSSADDPALRRAYASCEKLAREHYENFPVASKLLPKELRPHVAAIYAFARHADDFADEEVFEGQDRLALIEAWRERLRRCVEDPRDHDVFLALGHTITTRKLPMQPLEDLLDAFAMDVTVSSYETFDDLLGYCRLSANPVGRLMLLLFDTKEEELALLSDHICTALQLTNFWQDIAIDLDKKRSYLPLADMRKFGVTQESLAARRITPAITELVSFQVERTRKMFDDGAELTQHLRGRLRTEIRLVVAGGRRILDKIEAVNGDIFLHRPKLSMADWGRLLLSLAGREKVAAPAKPSS